MPKSLVPALVAAAALAALAVPVPAAAQQPELIPRQLIFGNPTQLRPKISPDGKTLAWLAPRDGVQNLWVAPVGQLDRKQPLTQEKVRPILFYQWSADSRRLLYTQDRDGDENHAIYGVDLATATTTQYTKFDKTQAQIIAVSPRRPGEVLIALNNRNPEYHDLHRLDLATGALTLVRRNDGYVSFVADWDYRPVLGVKPASDGGFVIERLLDDGKTATFLTIPAADALSTSPIGMSADGKTLFMYDSRSFDTQAVTSIDLATGKSTVLGRDARADVGDVITHPRTGAVEGYSFEYLKSTWRAVGEPIKRDIAFLNRAARGEWTLMSRSFDGGVWVLQVDRVTEPVAYYLYERKGRTFTRLFSARPALEGKVLAPMHPVEIKARDGLTLVAYLSLPPGSDRNRDGRPDQPLPLILNVHGGPWHRDSWGYHAEHQWMANRGYAVLAVNYRGSTGFGKKFLNAANGEFAGQMHDDLIDAVEWAIRSGITTRDSVAIYGGSYGGYATLVGLTFTPEVFACGVDIVGPSNLVTLIESFPAYWQPFMEATWYKRVGDPRTEAGKKALLERSPITRVAAIRKPLLIAQGANDPRVTQKESDQIVEAMKQKSIPVTYVLYQDEGHGFARPQSRTSFYAISEGFLSKCLGGRYERIGDDFAGAKMKVLEGAQYVPGLAEAIK